MFTYIYSSVGHVLKACTYAVYHVCSNFRVMCSLSAPSQSVLDILALLMVIQH